ncbi:MAG: hypothetical protein EPO65_06765 [Dehalococcoidia bacterium]|nr:MAG: hypothetical protein EPO65_06765 [Dehalococcoidia bacterium]
MKDAMLDAGTTALILGATLAFLVTIAAAIPESRHALAERLPEFIAGAFTAFMLSLSPKGGKDKGDAPPSPPVTNYPPDETTRGQR